MNDDWKPFSDVPTDGTPFLFYTVEVENVSFVGKICDVRLDSTGDIKRKVLAYLSYTDTRYKNLYRNKNFIQCPFTPVKFMPMPKPDVVTSDDLKEKVVSLDDYRKNK